MRANAKQQTGPPAVARRSKTPTASEFIASRKARLPGKLMKSNDLGRKATLYWRCDAVTLRQQSNHSKKVFIWMRQSLVKIEGEQHHVGEGAKVGDIEYRLGYYTVARNGRWWWGQYALMIPAADFVPLVEQAKSEGTLLS
jgi:hypothetical protein